MRTRPNFPASDVAILALQLLALFGLRLLDHQGNQRRRIPVPHRSSARSATIRRLALTPSGSRGLGMACNSSTEHGAAGGSAIP